MVAQLVHAGAGRAAHARARAALRRPGALRIVERGGRGAGLVPPERHLGGTAGGDCGYAVEWFRRAVAWSPDHAGTAKANEGLAQALARAGHPLAADDVARGLGRPVARHAGARHQADGRRPDARPVPRRRRRGPARPLRRPGAGRAVGHRRPGDGLAPLPRRRRGLRRGLVRRRDPLVARPPRRRQDGGGLRLRAARRRPPRRGRGGPVPLRRQGPRDAGPLHRHGRVRADPRQPARAHAARPARALHRGRDPAALGRRRPGDRLVPLRPARISRRGDLVQIRGRLVAGAARRRGPLHLRARGLPPRDGASGAEARGLPPHAARLHEPRPHARRLRAPLRRHVRRPRDDLDGLCPDAGRPGPRRRGRGHRLRVARPLAGARPHVRRLRHPRADPRRRAAARSGGRPDRARPPEALRRRDRGGARRRGRGGAGLGRGGPARPRRGGGVAEGRRRLAPERRGARRPRHGGLRGRAAAPRAGPRRPMRPPPPGPTRCPR